MSTDNNASDNEMGAPEQPLSHKIDLDKLQGMAESKITGIVNEYRSDRAVLGGRDAFGDTSSGMQEFYSTAKRLIEKSTRYARRRIAAALAFNSDVDMQAYEKSTQRIRTEMFNETSKMGLSYRFDKFLLDVNQAVDDIIERERAKIDRTHVESVRERGGIQTGVTR